MPEEKTTTETTKSEKLLDETKIMVKIYSPFRVYFNDEASSISAINDTGPFDVLPKHHNFITLLNGGEVTVRIEDKVQRFKIDRGVMHVKNNFVTVFLDV
jgi:F0F1-type ATP synthase epsilon subunit